MSAKDFDVVLYGATGFVGRQAVAYFAQYAPKDLRWAIAGRDRAALTALGVGVPILIADAGDQRAVDAIVARTRVVATTAGPFRLYGDPFVDACVRLGAHYVDISGETARIRDLIDRHHLAAERAAVRIVNFCAFSSAPADLGVFLLDKHLGGRLASATGFYRLGGGSFNGGTIASMSLAHDSGDAAREKAPFLLGPDQRAPRRRERDPRGLRYDRQIKAWTTPAPMGVSDTRAVRRSGVLNARDAVYQEYAVHPSFLAALGFNTVFGLFSLAMNLRPVRDFLKTKIPPGSGPSAAEMDAGWFELQVLGTSETGRSAKAVLTGRGDAGNRVTTLCFCESALALAVDEARLPEAHGVLTPSVALGQVLAERLRRAGVEIAVHDL